MNHTPKSQLQNPKSDRPRVLFICLSLTSFVKDDRAILDEFCDVRTFVFDAHTPATRTGRLGGVFAHGTKELGWLLRELPQADLVYGWFADYHLAAPVWLARAFGVPVAVPIAGFDAIELPALRYGVHHSRWRAPLARSVLRRAALLLPVSETMMETENTYSAYPKPLKNGVRHHVPGLGTPHEVVPFGYDPEAWPMGPAERGPVVLTVGHMTSDRTARRKGVDLLIEAARHLPEARVKVVGVPAEQAAALKATYQPPANVTMEPPRPRQALVAAYGEASVYAQLSRAEGQPNVLSEAMCCGCIPVGSPVFGIPETIGAAGYVAERPEPAHLAAVLRRALGEATPARRQAARQRIADHFSTERRAAALRRIVRRLVDGGD